LGVRPALGRDFRPEEELPGRHRVVILSDALWRTRFAGDPGVIGRIILNEGEPHEIIGVMPSSLHLPRGSQWGPLFAHNFDPLVFRPLGLDVSQRPGAGNLNYTSLVRLRTGARPQQAAAEMTAAIADFGRRFNFNWKPRLIPLHEQVTGSARSALWLLLGTVGAVLLIVCVNVGNLMLVRTAGRYREAGIRLALGAGRADLFGLVLKEALVVVAIGGAFGMLLAYAGLKLFVGAAPIDLPRIDEVRMDWRAIGFGSIAVVFSTFLCGLFPAWRLSRTAPQESLQAGGAKSTESGRKLRWRESMVSVEVALSTVLLVVGGLLIVSFFKVMRVEKGFEMGNVVTQSLALTTPQYRSPAARNRFVDEALEKLAGIPGVEAVGVTNQLPLQGETWINALVDAGRQADDTARREARRANFRLVSPDFWRALGIPLKQGRFFEARDRNRRVAVMSEAAARSLWPNENPVGKHVLGTGADLPALEVVGVVGEVKAGADTEAPMTVYQPYWDVGLGGPLFVLRTARVAASLAGDLRGVIGAIDPEIPLVETRTMEQILDESVAARRFETYLAIAFAGAAVLLAALGIYGVISFTVARRTPEMGIRMALGAQASQLLGMVLRQGMAPVLIGLGAGVAIALSISGLLSSQLYGVTGRDPLTISGVVCVLLLAGVMACWIPARRATRVDPMRALRFE
jgi:putative ABC transport system permease protein